MTLLDKPPESSRLRTRFSRRRIAWLHLYGHACIGLERFCPIERVICTDFGREFEFIRSGAGVQVLSLEEQTHKRQVASDANMRRLIPELGARIRTELHHAGGAWTLVCPFACRGLHGFAESAGWRAVSPDVTLSTELADKKVLGATLEKLKLPRIAGRWVRLGAVRYDELAQEFGPRFVLQKRSGSGGSGTAIVGSRTELLEAARRFGAGLVRIARFLGERSVNINAVATSRGVAVSWPNLQIVGLAELHARPGQHAGNDYSAAKQLPQAWIEDVVAQTQRLGRWAATRGHRGLFGLDFVFEEATGRAHAVDFNPRWQGSTVLLTQAEVRANRTPLAALEMAYRTGAISAGELLREYGDPYPVEGSQLGLHWRGPKAVRLRSEVPAGVVAIEAGKLTLRNPALEFSNLRSADEVLLLGGVPVKGTLLEPGASVLKVLSPQASVDARTLRLTIKAAAAVRCIYEELGLPGNQRAGHPAAHAASG